MPLKKDFYKVLGFPDNRDHSSITQDEIKKQYRQQILLIHPDKNKAPDADEKCKDINEAYAVLGDNDKRNLYDNSNDRKISRDKEELNKAYNDLHGLGGYFNKFLALLEGMLNFAYKVTAALILGPLFAAAAVIAIIPMCVAIYAAPKYLAKKLSLNENAFDGIGRKLLATPATIVLMPFVAAIGGLGITGYVTYNAITSAPDAFKERSVRGMNRQEKSQLFMTAVTITTVLLCVFPPAGFVAALGMASLSPFTFNLVFSLMTTVAAKAITVVAGKLYDWLSPKFNKPKPAPQKPTLDTVMQNSADAAKAKERSTPAKLRLTFENNQGEQESPIKQADFSAKQSALANLSLARTPLLTPAPDVIVSDQQKELSLTA